MCACIVIWHMYVCMYSYMAYVCVHVYSYMAYVCVHVYSYMAYGCVQYIVIWHMYVCMYIVIWHMMIINHHIKCVIIAAVNVFSPPGEVCSWATATSSCSRDGDLLEWSYDSMRIVVNFE